MDASSKRKPLLYVKNLTPHETKSAQTYIVLLKLLFCLKSS